MIAAMGSIVAHIHVVCSDPSKLEQADADAVADAEAEDAEDDEDDEIDEESILADQEKAEEAKKQRKLDKKKKKKNSQDDNDDDLDDGKDSDDDEEEVKAEVPEVNVKNMGQLSRVRDSVMNVLIERTHDKSYFTRAAILKTWASLLEANAVPVRHFSTICDIALDRLVDKTAMVRKNAISLLTAILDNNPFGGMLDIDHYSKARASLEGALISRVQFLRASNQVSSDEHTAALGVAVARGRGGKGKKAAAKLGVILEEDEEDEDDEDGEEGDESEKPEDDDARRLREQIELEEYNQFLQSEDVKGDADVIDLRAKLEYTEDTIRLIESMNRALKSIEDMLFSKSATDVTESLQFVARAVNFSIKGSAQCLQK